MDTINLATASLPPRHTTHTASTHTSTTTAAAAAASAGTTRATTATATTATATTAATGAGAGGGGAQQRGGASQTAHRSSQGQGLAPGQGQGQGQAPGQGIVRRGRRRGKRRVVTGVRSSREVLAGAGAGAAVRRCYGCSWVCCCPDPRAGQPPPLALFLFAIRFDNSRPTCSWPEPIYFIPISTTSETSASHSMSPELMTVCPVTTKLYCSIGGRLLAEVFCKLLYHGTIQDQER